MDDGIVLKDKERSLYLGMVPKYTKDLFLKLSEEEFSSHYGFTLQWLIDQSLEYQKVKQIILNPEFINNILGNNQETEKEEKKPMKQIKMLNGKIKGENNEKIK